VAQACLARLTDQSPALHSIVTSLQGKAGQLGSTQQGTFFLQKLVEVLGGETGPAYLLQEDILVNIGTLCMSEAGTRLVQCVVKVGSVSCLVRVARWLELHMDVVVVTRAAVFTALAVVERAVTRIKEGEESCTVVLDTLAGALLCEDTVSRQPLLITAALHPVGHLLAREMVSKVNILTGIKDTVLSILLDNLDTLRYTKTGANVLRGLQGVV